MSSSQYCSCLHVNQDMRPRPPLHVYPETPPTPPAPTSFFLLHRPLSLLPPDTRRLSDEKRMGRRRAARTPATSASAGRALAPLTPTDLVKHVPRKFATLWVGTAGGHHGAAGPPSSTPDGMPGAESEAPMAGGVASSGQNGGANAGAGARRG